MTGEEFHIELKRAGYTQDKFSKLLGVHRSTIVTKCQAAHVEPCWVLSLAALIAAKSNDDVNRLVDRATAQ